MTTTEEVPMPETPIFTLSVDGTHIHFSDGSGSSAESLVKTMSIHHPEATCEVKRLYTADQLRAYDDARCAKLQAERDALAEKVKAMEDNDRRYRWLRDKANDANRSAPMVVSNPLDRSLQTLLHGERLDAAIDAAGGDPC